MMKDWQWAPMPRGAESHAGGGSAKGPVFLEWRWVAFFHRPTSTQ
jgi:hypothetical protein